jgi:serine/threonine-protein kinase
MSKVSKAKSPKTVELPKGPLRLLLGLAVAESLLAIYQWVELLTLRRGGTTVCDVNQTLSCGAVWNSRFASAVHEVAGMPVAGLGLVWGVAAVFLTALALLRKGKAQAQVAPALLPAIRFLGVVGAGACLVFAIASVTSGSLCIMCLATYALVVAFAAVALAKLPGPFFPSSEQMPRTLLWTLGPMLGAYVLLLLPGAMTPHGVRPGDGLAKLPDGGGTGAAPGTLADFIRGLSPMEAQALSDMLQEYRHGLSATAQKPRVLKGQENAPVRIVEFTDLRCGHCRSLVENMNALEKALPPGTLAVDARHFPLDSTCNRLMTASDGTTVRCVGAKAQICLENAPDYWELRDKLFAAQEGLSPERVLQIASSGTVKRAELEACITSPETARKLAEDVDYAAQVKPRGTPIVLINGKVAPPMPALLYALALARGNPDAPELARLPPPAQRRDPHEGHGH